MEEIVKKYLEGEAGSREQLQLLNWLRHPKNRPVFQQYKSGWKKNRANSWFPADAVKSWNSIEAAIVQKSFSKWQKSKKVYLIYKYAAIFFFVLSLAGTIRYYTSINQPPVFHTSVMAENGQISKVELPDGSLVWLNSGSHLQYNTQFATKNRDILLSGEAYFEVKRNTKTPFIVSCNNLKIKVTGTTFNVSSYPENKTVDIVLESGSVELSNKKSSSFSYTMKPGEMAQFETENQKLQISQVNTTRLTSWKDGIINIYNQSLSEVVKRLEIRYNQNFDFDEEIKDFHYTFTIKNEPLSEIIQLMEKITPVKAVQKEDVIIFCLDKNKLREAD
jgi:ferric-dicitrate binding protein FerR (iron transport regulator)